MLVIGLVAMVSCRYSSLALEINRWLGNSSHANSDQQLVYDGQDDKERRPRNREMLVNFVCERADNMQDVFFEPEADEEEMEAPEPSRVMGQQSGSDACEEDGDYIEIAEAQQAVDGSRTHHAQQSLTGTALETGEAGDVDSRGERSESVAGLQCAAGDVEEDTYVPISDIIARKRCTQQGVAAASTNAMVTEEPTPGDTESSCVIFNQPKRAISVKREKNPSCLYTRLAGVKLQPGARDSNAE